MNFDFTTIMDRAGKDALAVDGVGTAIYPGVKIRDGFSVLPMWVADMNFATAPSVQEAILRRAQHPAFGYFNPPDAYYDAILSWHRNCKPVEGLTRDCIGYENGVLGGVVSALNVLCSKGDSILVHAPTYIGFTSSLRNNGYRIVHSPLVQDADGVWRMDFADMEEKIQKHHIHTAIFCSPHNPTGRVWERWELEQAMEIYRRNDVYVISDEIWSDLILKGRHIPTQAVSEDARQRTVALYAPSKTFNLAGLVGSYHIICNPWLRDRIKKESSLSHYDSMNVLSMHALMGAYSPEGREWVDQLCRVLGGNVDFACDYIAQHFPGVQVTKPQGTYMLFLDCTQWCRDRGVTLDRLLEMGAEVGVIWQDGRPFHGPCHIRMNLALPRSLVEEAFHRLDKYVFHG
ncbi:MAG: MalY/PatB family protein [Candidatus Avoscillospira sp.]